MKLPKRGKNTSKVSIHATPNGLWILYEEKEFFLSFESYPWFKKASLESIFNVKVSTSGNLHWPDLDVDIEIDSLRFPEKYPLTYR